MHTRDVCVRVCVCAHVVHRYVYSYPNNCCCLFQRAPAIITPCIARCPAFLPLSRRKDWRRQGSMSERNGSIQLRSMPGPAMRFVGSGMGKGSSSRLFNAECCEVRVRISGLKLKSRRMRQTDTVKPCVQKTILSKKLCVEEDCGSTVVSAIRIQKKLVCPGSDVTRRVGIGCRPHRQDHDRPSTGKQNWVSLASKISVEV